MVEISNGHLKRKTKAFSIKFDDQILGATALKIEIEVELNNSKFLRLPETAETRHLEAERRNEGLLVGRK